MPELCRSFARALIDAGLREKGLLIGLGAVLVGLIKTCVRDSEAKDDKPEG